MVQNGPPRPSGLSRPSLSTPPPVGTRWQPKTGKSTGPVCHRLANPSAGVLFLQQAADNGGGGIPAKS